MIVMENYIDQMDGEMENKSFLKPYICTQCGGKVNRTTLVCEMCGTHFKDESQGESCRLIVTRPGVVTLEQSIDVDMEHMMYSPAEFSQYIIKQLAREFADCIAPYMSVETENHPYDHTCTIRARVRLLEPDYRF